MGHKIFSEYDRVQVENIFPAHRRHTADLNPDDDVNPPRSRLPRRALSVAAIVAVLAVFAAVLWPETLDTILHRNRDISQIGVPIGVPEDSSTSNAASGDNSPPNSSVATTNTTNATSAMIVASNQRSESGASQREVGEPNAAATNSGSEQTAVTQNANLGVKSATTGAKAARRSLPPTTKRYSTAISRRERGVQAQPYEYDDRMPPLHPGSVRARVLGRTPDGELIVALPSGETAIVETPRRRMRPIPIERRERFAPPFQPFDPTFPPVD